MSTTTSAVRAANPAHSAALSWAAWTVGGAAVMTGLAQVVVPLPLTPVPLSLATLGVWMLAGLGGWRGSAGVGLYLILALAGAPVLAEWSAGFVPSFGYVVGYALAAVIVAALRQLVQGRRRGSRMVLNPLARGAVALVGTLAVYGAGLPWLAVATGMDLHQTLAAGLLPFMVGDGIKVLAAAAIPYGPTYRRRTGEPPAVS